MLLALRWGFDVGRSVRLRLVDFDGGGTGKEERTSDSPADQRRSMSVNVRGAARTWREVVRERRVRVVVRKCIFGGVGGLVGFRVVEWCGCSCGFVSVKND